MIVLSVTFLLLAGFVSTATEVSPPRKPPTAGVLRAAIFTCQDALLPLPIWARSEYEMTGTQAWKQTLAQATQLLLSGYVLSASLSLSIPRSSFNPSKQAPFVPSFLKPGHPCGVQAQINATIFRSTPEQHPINATSSSVAEAHWRRGGIDQGFRYNSWLQLTVIQNANSVAQQAQLCYLYRQTGTTLLTRL